MPYELANDSDMRPYYNVDADGNLYPIAVARDAAGNAYIASEDPNYKYLLGSQIVNTVGGIFGGRGGGGRYYDNSSNPAVQVQATPQGIGAGISTNTLLIGGLVLAFFLFGRKGR